ncbi:MAG: YafY family transcriptional regulator [Defluviitaleaceae bacterium]|nr:YafY family transcriptional regulator [Defluviitaleaceae bacterium]
MQTSRMFEIIYLLLTHENMKARELAERFGVSTRTIYRDVDALSLAGIPVYMEKGRNGGIRLLPEFVLNKSILSEREQNEILTALQGHSFIGDGKAGQVLHRLSGIFNKAVVNWLEVDFSDWSFGDGDIFDNFKTAILERRIAEFDYYSTYGEKTHRRVEPIQLWFKSKAWYLKGFCLKKQDIRLFKLLRVNNLAVTNESFEKRDLLAAEPAPSSEAYNMPDITMRLRIAPAMAYRVYDEFAEDMVEKQPDGSYMVTVTWPEDNWVYGFLLSFGGHIEVLAPERMREIIKGKALEIAGQY